MIIKCPECGHQVSDKAPICPSCGVEIADHIIKCSNCQEIYLSVETSCPNCHHTEPITYENDNTDVESCSIKEEHTENISIQNQFIIISEDEPIDDTNSNTEGIEGENKAENNDVEAEASTIAKHKNSSEEDSTITEYPTKEAQTNAFADEEYTEESTAQQALDSYEEIDTDESALKEGRKTQHVALLISVVIAIGLAGILIYFYNSGLIAKKDQKDYKEILASDDVDKINSYLNNNKGANLSQQKALKARIAQLEEKDKEWLTVVAQSSFQAYKNYLSKYPDTPYKPIILTKMDSIAWGEAVAADNEAGYFGYKNKMPNGKHNKEADEKLKVLLDNTATPEEQSRAVSVVREFLRGINAKSKEKIQATIQTPMTFRGISGSGVDNVMAYIREKLYQADVKQAIWHLGTPVETTTEKLDDGTTEQHLTITGKLVFDREGGKSQTNYTIKAIVKSGKIVAITW